MRCAAFNTGPDYHLLDHIAPLADLLQCPLMITEELNTELAKRYYPQIEVHYVPDLEFRLKSIAEAFDFLFECKYWQPHLKALFRTLYNKEMRLIFCPHGQSDKGYQAPVLAPYALQDGILVYGQLMLDMLRELKIAIPDHAIVGNYRLEFYTKYQSFYDNLAPKIDLSKKTLLYAPTWCDLDNSSSFYRFGKKVLADLPSDWNLIIKLHPSLKLRKPVEFATFNFELPNVYLMDEFPPVYPILALADCYLGDASSVGYDFLVFEKPLYFFPSTAKRRLHSCGQFLDLSKNIFSQIELTYRHQEEQRALYRYAFNKTVYSPTGGMMNSVCKSFKLQMEERTSISKA